MQLQQQLLAAQQAEQRLMAFCESKDRSSLGAAVQQAQEVEPASTAGQVQQPMTAQQQVCDCVLM